MSYNKDINPYLSIVVTSRNDDYGGDYYNRFKAGINGILLQAERHHLRSELILVEWNPPSGKPLLKDVFAWPLHSSFCSVRAIVVPASIHARYDFSKKIPVHGSVAANVGIRRARGEFILSTCADDLFCDEVIKFLASEQLDKNAMYGMNRYNVRREVTLLPTLEQQLIYCQGNVTSVNNLGSCYFGSSEAPVLNRHGSGDFILFSKERWHLLHGFPEIDIISVGCDAIVGYMAYLSGAREVILGEPMRIYHIEHSTRRQYTKRKIVILLETIYMRLSWLMRFSWLKSFAHILGYVVYKLFPPQTVLESMGLASLGRGEWNGEWSSPVIDMIRGERSYIFNDENWGLGQETLEEFVISTADWDKRS